MKKSLFIIFVILFFLFAIFQSTLVIISILNAGKKVKKEITAIVSPVSPAVKIQYNIKDRYGDIYEVYKFQQIDSIRSMLLLGYMNQYGKILIPVRDWNFIGRPLEGVIPYADSIETGYYDVKSGKKFDLTCKGFRFYSNFKHGRALAIMNGKFGLVNKAGKIIIPFIYTDFERLGEHNAEMKENKIVMYNGETKTIINHQTGKRIN